MNLTYNVTSILSQYRQFVKQSSWSRSLHSLWGRNKHLEQSFIWKSSSDWKPGQQSLLNTSKVLTLFLFILLNYFLLFYYFIIISLLFSNKFWKKFDSVAVSLHKELIKASQKATRHFTREILKYIGEKNTINQTTFNHITDIWENVLQGRCPKNEWKFPFKKGQK